MAETKNTQQRNKDELFQYIADESGMSIKKVKELTKNARLNLGIKLNTYVKLRFWEIPEDRQEEEFEAYKRRRAATIKKARVRKAAEKEHEEEKNKCIELVCEKTGWDFDAAKEKINQARKRTGCGFVEYYRYKFYEKDEKEQDTFMLDAYSRPIGYKYDNPLFVRLVKNKQITNTLFSKYIHRKWCSFPRTKFERFSRRFRDVDRIVYKPNGGIGGEGIKFYDLTPDNIQEVFDDINEQRGGIVEECITNHHAINELNSSSINTVRLVTISWIEDFEIKADLVYGCLRVGNNQNVDNLHSGGMAAAIDLETGKLCTSASNRMGDVFEKHPSSGVTFKGFQIPCFEEAKAYVMTIMNEFKISGYIGWDIAITENGPDLIEINTYPAVMCLQAPYIGEDKGMRHIMEKYMD